MIGTVEVIIWMAVATTLGFLGGFGAGKNHEYKQWVKKVKYWTEKGWLKIIAK